MVSESTNIYLSIDSQDIKVSLHTMHESLDSWYLYKAELGGSYLLLQIDARYFLNSFIGYIQQGTQGVVR